MYDSCKWYLPRRIANVISLVLNFCKGVSLPLDTLDKVQLAFMEISTPLTTTHIDKFIAYYGKPGENRETKRAKLLEVLDLSSHATSNHQGVHIIESIESYEAY